MNLIIAFLNPLFYAVTNLLDEKIEKGMGREPQVTTFYTIFTSIVFAVAVGLWFGVRLPPAEYWVYLLPLALINVLYLIPYYKSVELADTSVVVSLFSLNRVFTLFLAYIVLGEYLNWWQGIGFVLVILGCFFLTFDWKKHHPKKVMYLMGLSTLLISAEGIVLKLFLDTALWYEVFVWTGASVFFVNLLQIFVPEVGRKIVSNFSNYRKNFRIIFVEELFTFLGYISYIYALSQIDVLVVKAVDSVQPLFVLLLGVAIHKLFGLKLHEDDHLKNIEWKLFWFFIKKHSYWNLFVLHKVSFD
jgi:drug/metabolite transporter (DMT)-like permease